LHIFVTNLPVYAIMLLKSGEEQCRAFPVRHKHRVPFLAMLSTLSALYLLCTHGHRSGAYAHSGGGGKHMTFKPCPRCGTLIPCGMAYCEGCRQLRSAQRQTRRNAESTDDKQYRAFYRSAVWKRTSLAKLSAASYQCEAGCKGCTGRAVEVHHIKPIQTPEGWALRLDWANLEAVCTRCHNRRHNR
jgi:5-methylcytosine-specific restriction endonuclease McrA